MWFFYNKIQNSGLQYTIFRPSYIIGNDDYLTNLTELLIKINEYDSVKCKNVLDLISTFSNLKYS